MNDYKKITVAYGDGIGPEIMSATLKLITTAGAKLEIETIEIGEKIYNKGNTSGIEKSSWDSLRRTKVFLKAPIMTPQGKGHKSLNVTIRKTLALYANVRPCVSLHPYIKTKYPDLDIVTIRENEEDLYGGIEYRQTQQVAHCLKLISRPGSERIIRYAFDFAVKNKRKKVSCFVKDNIMKITDGLFHSVFNEIGEEYPDIEKEVLIVDIGTARMTTFPEAFDVIVTENLYGDIISDVAAEMIGSVGLAGSANIGAECAMFEAIHGSAPDIAGKNIANPSGLIQGAILMLNHIGQPDIATLVRNAWLKTIEDGIHTADIYDSGISEKVVGTTEFTDAIIERIGEKPKYLKAIEFKHTESKSIGEIYESVSSVSVHKAIKNLVGVDVFLDWSAGTAEDLGELLSKVNSKHLKLIMISNRGVKVWPEGMPETFNTDFWRCRFVAVNKGEVVTHLQITKLLEKIYESGFDFVKTELLYNFNGQPGYSLAQGE